MKETLTIGREIGYLDHHTGIVHPTHPDAQAEDDHAEAEDDNAGRRGRVVVEEVDTSPDPETPDPVPRNRSRSRSRIVRE